MSLLKKFHTVVAVAAFAATTTLGFAGDAFATIPESANVVFRVDFDGLAKLPPFTKAIGELQQKEGAPLGQLVLQGVLAGDANSQAKASDAPGRIAIMEAGLVLQTEGEPEPVGFVARGTFDGQGVLKNLQASGYKKSGEVAKLSLYHRERDNKAITMLNAQTLVAARSTEALQKMVAASGGQGGLRKSGKPMTALMSAADSSVAFLGVEIPASAKKAVEDAAKENEGQLAMIPFAPTIVAEIKNVSCAALCLSSADGGRFYIAATFVDAASAKRMTDALNAVVPVVMQMAKQQLGTDDPEALKRMDEMAATKFTSDGTRVSTSLRITENMGKNIVSGLMENIRNASESDSTPAKPAAPARKAGK